MGILEQGLADRVSLGRLGEGMTHLRDKRLQHVEFR